MADEPQPIAATVRRLRKRHHQLLRLEVALTVDRPEDVDAELRELLSVL